MNKVNPFTSNMSWTPAIKVDGEFTYTRTVDHAKGNYIQTDLRFLPNQTVLEASRQLHPTFQFLRRAPSNYVTYKGRVAIVCMWLEHQDERAVYFHENLANAPLCYKHLMTDYDFDMANRVFTYVVDIEQKTTYNQWTDMSDQWTVDGVHHRVEFVNDQTSWACSVPKDPWPWVQKMVRLDGTQPIVYTTPSEQEAKAVYIAVLDGSASLNGTIVEQDFVARVTSPSLTIEAVNGTQPVILIREKQHADLPV